MKKAHYLFIILFISNLINAQIEFEPGYYINNENQTIKGLIKNVDWRNNPNSFDFKVSPESEVENISIDYATEFGIDLKTKYVRADIDIEKSSINVNKVGHTKEPQFNNERLFLKELVNGSARLFVYESNGIEKFFYSVTNAPIKQLIYIKYFPSAEDIKNNRDYDNNTILTNDYFKRQLWYDVKCSDNDKNKISGLEFKRSYLVNYFSDFNKCKGDTKVVTNESGKTAYSIKASVIYNISSIKVEDFSPSFSPEFSGSNFGFGLEAELFLPFNNKKWSVLFEPSYNHFKGDKYELPAYGVSKPMVASMDLEYFQLPFGIRHYFFLNNSNKIFLNAVGNVRYVTDGSSIKYESSTAGYPFTTTSFSVALGAGYNYKKFSGEFRYFFESNVTGIPAVPVNFNNMSFILRYELFGRK